MSVMMTSRSRGKRSRRLERLYRRRVPPAELLTPELARQLTEISQDLHRQVGVLLDRQGFVTHVLVGDAKGLLIPPLPRERGARGRLKGLRLIHTHLDGAPLNQDDFMDLALLRLDAVAVLTVSGGQPGTVQVAHLLPQPLNGHNWSIMEARQPGSLNLDFEALVASLEEEFLLAAPGLAAPPPFGPYLRQVLLEPVQAVPEAPAVHLQLGFPGTPAADAAHEAGQGVPFTHQPGQQVLHLGHLHLELAFPAAGPLGEEVQDELGAVDDLQFGEVGDGAHLGGAQFGVKDQQVGPRLQGLDHQLREPPFAHQKPGVEAGPALDDGLGHGKIRGAGQFGQLLHGVFGAFPVGAADPDEDGPLLAAASRRRRRPGKFFLQGRHQGLKVQVQAARLPGLHDAPVMAVQGLGQQVGHLHRPRLAAAHRQDGHRVQAQQGQVHEVVLVQRGAVQVRVNQTQALETAPGAPFPGQGRDQQALGVPHQDVGDESLAVQQNPHLPVQVLGDLRQLPGQFRGQEFRGRHPAAVQPLQPPVLMRF
ncbi:MAG: hypothetical protein A3K23_04955 [Desulfobacca sp. RBG_16_58_9]|nr:MAG: hypothetical protein A3K23_04955 [Desulfobacca sp. RBG_16_58_9]